ncbi:Nodulin-like protein [Novymonas esmeraldas]|uniref:Nodulin-like protein n=1 Tax=Novymonas esmeraldas TaxID=1808958 RepID=A0AAW0ER52_9TRYP
MFDGLQYTFSQTKYVADRTARGLHVIDEVKRFRALVCALFCSICVSLVFAFDLFSSQFQERFNLSDGDLSTISTVGVVFCYFVIPYGILYDNIGPLPLLVIAGVVGFIGCLGLGLIFDGRIPGNTATISVFYAFMNTCSGLFDAASIVTLVELFPRNRGPVIGLAKVMTGLGSSVLSSMNRGFFSTNISGFIYFIMALTVAVSVTAIMLISLPPYFVNWWRARNRSEEDIAALKSLEVLYAEKFVPVRRIAYGYVIVACLVIFFAITAPVLAYTKVSNSGKAVVGAITVVLCMSFWVMALPIPWLGGVNEPAPLPLRSTLDDAECEVFAVEGGKSKEQPSNEPLSTSPLSPDEAAHEQARADAAAAIEEGPQDPRYGGTIWDTLKRPDIWLILIAFVCQGALGTIVTYNGSTIYVARTGRPRTAGLGSLYTAFIGVGSAVGRISMGLFEAYVQHQKPENRKFLVTVALPVAPIIATIAGILILVLPGDALLFPYILVYFEEGVFNGVRALIFPCIFSSHHGILYNMSFCTNVIGVICFNRFLFGLTVDRERENMGHTVEQGCTSRVCVQTPIIVVTCTAAFAAVLATVVHVRYVRFVAKCRKGVKSAIA